MVEHVDQGCRWTEDMKLREYVESLVDHVYEEIGDCRTSPLGTDYFVFGAAGVEGEEVKIEEKFKEAAASFVESARWIVHEGEAVCEVSRPRELWLYWRRLPEWGCYLPTKLSDDCKSFVPDGDERRVELTARMTLGGAIA